MKKMLVAVKWILAAAVCILLAFAYEKHYLAGPEGVRQEYRLEEITHPGFEYVDGELESVQPDAQLILPVDGYVQSLHITYTMYALTQVTWTSMESPDAQETGPETPWLADHRTHDLYKPIEAEAGPYMRISFTDIHAPMRVSGISLTDVRQFHVNRFVFHAAALMALASVLIGLQTLRKHPERIVAVVCGLLGVAMLVSVPYEKCSWDDETHFKNAYRLSYTLQGKDTQWTQAAEDFITLGLPFSYSYQERLATEQRLDEEGSVFTRVEANGGVSYVIHTLDCLPTAVGILIGRTAGVPFSDWFLGARLANLLFYTVLVYFSIRITPKGKSLMAFLALLPTPLYLTMTYNTDFYMNGLMLLGTAVFLREFFTPDKKLSARSIALFVLTMFFACCRKTIYIPLILMGLFLPKEKYSSKKQKYIYYAILIGSCILDLAMVAVGASGMSDARGGDTSVTGQMEHILHHPVSFLILLAKRIIKMTPMYLFDGQAKLNFNILGRYSESLEIVVLITLLLLIVGARGWDGSCEVKWRSTLKVYVLVGIVICFIFGSMYLAFTPVGENAIHGVSARYYTPLLPIVFLMVPLKRIRLDISEKTLMPVSLVVAAAANILCVRVLMLMSNCL